MSPLLESSSSASLAIGVRGIAISPVRADRRLYDPIRLDECQERLHTRPLSRHFHNDAMIAHIYDPRAELVRERMQRAEMLMTLTQRLARRERLPASIYALLYGRGRGGRV